MTKEEIYSVFDGGDPETAVMKLAVSFPRFGRRDLEDVLRELASSKDRYELEWLSKNKFKAFKTIFFIMFNTSLWDIEILFQPDFLPFVHGMKAKLAECAKAAGYRDHWTSDLYEVFAEMEDRIVGKIRSRPEGTACPG